MKLDVTTRPAHVLGQRHSTIAEVGAIRVQASTKAEALAILGMDVMARLRMPDPVYRGGATTQRVYALTCSGAHMTNAGVPTYSWNIAILNPQHKHAARGGMAFSAPTEGEAVRRLEEYADSCESAARDISSHGEG